MRIETRGLEELSNELRRLDQLRWEVVSLKNLTEMYNRGKAGGTPVATGELRQSLGVSPPSSGFEGETGYRSGHAAHVEYGHRLVAWGHDTGKFIPGQHYLRDNVEVQRPIFKQDILDNLRGR